MLRGDPVVHPVVARVVAREEQEEVVVLAVNEVELAVPAAALEVVAVAVVSEAVVVRPVAVVNRVAEADSAVLRPQRCS